jgi:pyruvate dehydrogenase E1 component beta subunit
MRPIAELMFIDFLTVGMDQLVNQAAKMRYMFGGKISIPMVLRVPAGGGISAAAQHSQSLEAWVTHIPGLKVVYPSTPQDALGLMLAAIDDDDPVVMIENKVLYGSSGEVSSLEAIPLGKGDIKRAGKDMTIVAYGRMVTEALAAAEVLAKEGIECEVVDPRSLYPLDKALIGESIARTHKALVVTEEAKRGGYGGEISAIIAEEFFDSLDAPVVRVGALNAPIPFSPPLEQYVLPNSKDIVAAARKMF